VRQLQQQRGNAFVQRAVLRAASSPPVARFDSAGNGRQSPGFRLDSSVRGLIEGRFGESLPDVQIHADSASASLASRFGADAVTYGSHIYFGEGRYQPSLASGQRLLAHELVHTLQQRANPGALQTSPAVSRPDDAAEREADAVASQVVGGSDGSRQLVPRQPGNDVAAGWEPGGGTFGGGGASGSWEPANPEPTTTGPRVAPRVAPVAGRRVDARPPQAAAPALPPIHCDLEPEDRVLFERREYVSPTVGRSREVQLWKGRVSLGDFGFIEARLLGRIAGSGQARLGIGPGVLQNICLALNPFTGEYGGKAELYIPAEVDPVFRMMGSLFADASYLAAYPLLSVEGGLQATGSASLLTALTLGLAVTYRDGVFTFAGQGDLRVGPLLTFNVDAFAAAGLLGSEVWRKIWRLYQWRWQRAWRMGAFVTFTLSGGKLSPITVIWYLEEVPIEELAAALMEAAESRDRQRKVSTPSTGVPMLTEATAKLAKDNIVAKNYAGALQVVVDELHTAGVIDTSKCAIRYTERSDRGEGYTLTKYRKDPTTRREVPAGPSDVQIFTPAFTSVSWLVSSVMHEYQHVLQTQRSSEPAEFREPGQSEGREAREVEAYLWELEHAEETGVIASAPELKDLQDRLSDHYYQLSQLNQSLSTQYQERYWDAMKLVAHTVVSPPPLPDYENVFHHGTDKDQAEYLLTADIRATGKIDFGLGFYTHSRYNWYLAKEWAIRKSRQDRKPGWGVVSFPVPDDIWDREVVSALVFQSKSDQPGNVPINPETGQRFRNWQEFVDYNRKYGHDPREWPQFQVISGRIAGKYEDRPDIRQIVFTSSGVPVLNLPDVRKLRVAVVGIFKGLRTMAHLPSVGPSYGVIPKTAVPTAPGTPTAPVPTGGAPSTGGTTALGPGDPGGTTVVPTNLHAFGGKEAPRDPRIGQDMHPVPPTEDGIVGPTTPPEGASTFGDPNKAPLTGHYHRLAKGTTLVEGVKVLADGRDVGGPHLETHHTLYPARSMRMAEFVQKFRILGWVWAGKKDRK
jgi:hypothetical protein